MSFPIRPRQLVFVGAWLATAAVAYTIGSMGVPPQPKGAAVASGPSSGDPGIPQAPGSADVSLSLGKSAGGSSAERPTTAQITGGMPTGEYLKQLLALDDEAARTSGFLRILETLNSPEEIENALTAVAEAGGDRSRGPMRVSREYALLLERYTKLDANAAATYASDPKRNNEERWFGTGTVLKTWTRLDADAAIAWAQANGNPPADGNNQGRPGADGNWAVASVVAQLARTDLPRALEVAKTQDVSRSRGRMMDTLLTELLTQRPETAVRGTILAMPAGTFRDGMLVQLARRQVGENPATTAQWVAALPPGDGQNKALAEVIGPWTKADPVAAAKYLTGVPISPSSDPMREQFVNAIAKTNPPDAIAWAATISDQNLRDRMTQIAGRTWMITDAPAATTWLANANLSDEAKARITTPPDQRGRGGNRGPQN